MTAAEKEDFNQYYATLNESADEQLSGLHRAVAAVIHSKMALDDLKPTIRFYDDSRKDGKRCLAVALVPYLGESNIKKLGLH